MKAFLFLLAAILCITAPVMAAEEDVPTNLQKKYDRRLEEMKPLDKNGDGVLQAEELQESVESKFDAVDKNGDGVISPEEQQAAIGGFRDKGPETYGTLTDQRTRRLERRYKNADDNEDGQISEQEYEAYFKDRYGRYDRDGDGVVNEKEYRTDVEKAPSTPGKKN